ncbi:MAG: hypothetical protein KHY93_02595 [Clostridiales bacterium]|nr:hypothetical protein [Clostridiales bacterium]
MRVAIVDEGIDRQALLYPERIRKTLILHEGTTLHDIPEGEHGTTCARLLEQCTDNYELFDVRITESWNAPVPVNDLKRALECCIREKINIICLSLGTIYLSEESVLTPVMQEIKEKKIRVVASLSNEGKMTLPGAYPEVFCTAMDWQDCLRPGECRITYHNILKRIYVANIKTGANKLGDWRGNSYAVPVIAGELINWTRTHDWDTTDKWLENQVVSFSDFKRATWGKPSENPVVAIYGSQKHFPPEALLSTFSKEFLLEAAALVEEDSGNHFQILSENDFSACRQEILADMDSYLGVFILLSFYEEENIEQKENFYDVEVFCKERDIEFYGDGRFMCAVPVSSDIKYDICKTLIQILS